MPKSIPYLWMTKTAEKPYPLGRTYLYSPYKGVPPRGTPDGGDSDLPNEVCDIINCIAICFEKDVRAGVPSFAKKSSEPRFQGK